MIMDYKFFNPQDINSCFSSRLKDVNAFFKNIILASGDGFASELINTALLCN